MPRTGSRSLNAHFAATWQGPLFGTASPAQLREIKSRSKSPTFVKLGRGHDNLGQLLDQLYRHGRTVRQMKRIVFVVRNPYHLVSSNYHFLRDQAAGGHKTANALMAAESSFDEFCARSNHPDPANWMMTDGALLNNMHILKFENLAEDVSDFDKGIGVNAMPLPHLNRSKFTHNPSAIFTERSESTVYERYRALFELGHYSRREGL